MRPWSRTPEHDLHEAAAGRSSGSSPLDPGIPRLHGGSAPGPAERMGPVKDPTRGKDLGVIGRPYDVYQHDAKADWGYKAPQKDVFVVVHPKEPRKGAPLYVVLHSAGHDVLSCVKCTAEVGNHDIYRSPEDFYALYLDCRANRGDWWWGGMHAKDEGLIQKNSGGDPAP